jgi:SAM-dependent methyltransferase
MDHMTEPEYLDDARSFYDAIAADYADHFRDELQSNPWERAMLATFAEVVGPDRPVLEVGCGPGRVTGHLSGLGLSITGMDLSPAMVDVARAAHPDVPFEVGSMTDLDRPDGALAAIVAWYSIIHLPPGLLPETFAGFHRALAPGGHLLVAFQVGDEALRVAEPFGHPVSLDFQRCDPDRVAGLLADAGFVVTARLVREPSASEKVPQAYLLAQRPVQTAPSL